MANAPAVYMTRTISSDSLLAIYKALGRVPRGKVAVKLSSGEPGNKHYLNPQMIAPLVSQVSGTIVECNTAYGGGRATTADHYQVMKDHGFADIAPVLILDETDEIALPVTGGKHLTENFVGAHFKDFDSYMILSHFKGHTMGGFGGALKNMAIGFASSHGKLVVHGAGNAEVGFAADQDSFLESMAEASKSCVDAIGPENFVYINVMNKLSVDCDCDGNAQPPCMEDIGVLASLDPVALDQACIDLIYSAPDKDQMVERIESRHGLVTLAHAEEIGLGSKSYELVEL